MVEDLILYLDQGRDAAPLRPEGQLFREQIVRAMELLENARQSALRESESTKNRESDSLWDPVLPHRVHQNVGILGRRGAGKTSFLLTLLQLLSQGRGGLRDEYQQFRHEYAKSVVGSGSSSASEDPDEAARNLSRRWNELAEDTVVLGPVEPSLMEKGDNVVAAAYALLLQRARDLVRHQRAPHREEDARQADEMLRAAQQVTDNLPVLFAENRLQEVFKRDGAEGLYEEIVEFRSGFNLERSLRDFIAKYLAFERRPLIILALDDVDLAYDKGWEVLEALRRYLTSQRMLILVTGDADLFSAVLKDAFKLTSGNEYLAAEVTTQYMKKVLPPWLRVNLSPVVDPTRLEKIAICRRRPVGASEEAEVDSFKIGFCEQKVGFREHFAHLLLCCLRDPTPSKGAQKPAKVQSLFYDYRYLIPEDMRRFLELASIDLPEDVDALDTIPPERRNRRLTRVLLEFAAVWEDRFESYHLPASRLATLIPRRRLGAEILNLLGRRFGLTRPTLRLDPHTDDPDLNRALAFLRFTIEAHLDLYQPRGLLSLGLDFVVPAYYLSRLASEELRADLAQHLKLIDSPGQVYQRLVPELGRRYGIQPGVVPLVSQSGLLEAFLDLQDERNTAWWRWIMGDTSRTTLPRWLDEAAERCQKFLGGHLTEERKGRASRDGDGAGQAGSKAGADDSENRFAMSGYHWSTHHLPDLLRKAQGENYRFHRLRADPRDRNEFPRPTMAEYVVTPHLFHELAGALPSVVLRCWTVEEGVKSYLSVWQGLALIQRIIEELSVFQQTSRNGEGPDLDMAHALYRQVYDSLRHHLAIGATSRTTTEKKGAVDGAGLAEIEQALEIHPRHWGSLRDELRAAESPAFLYPILEGSDLRWVRTRAVFPDPNDPARRECERRFEEGKLFGAWNEDWSDERQGKNEPISTWAELQDRRLRARDALLERLATAITEWAVFWWRQENLRRKPEETGSGGEASEQSAGSAALAQEGPPVGRQTFQDIQDIFDTVLANLDNEKEFADVWSGAGDVIQRWVLTFLNAVLVQTLEPADAAGETTARRPSLATGMRQLTPVREKGEVHPLYHNLTRLCSGGNVGGFHDGWRLSRSFLALASFPLLGLFLPDRAPLTAGSKGGCAEAEKECVLTLDNCIQQIGRLALKEFSNEQAENSSLYLVGLSWCGLRVQGPKGDSTPGKDSIEERQKILLEMLNAVMADVVAPVEEAEKHRPYLFLAISEALQMEQREYQEKQRKQEKQDENGGNRTAGPSPETSP